MSKFNLRVVPWFTDGCSTFLANLFKWLPRHLNTRLSVLEFGGGNSTLFFLSKKLKVISIESDEGYVDFLSNVSRTSGFSVGVFSDPNGYLRDGTQNDLSIIFAKKIEEIPSVMDLVKTDIIVNDGISRREVLEKIMRDHLNSIVILDNVEYAANWGRLERSSAKPDLIKVYRSFLRSTDWQSYIFEQSEGRDGHGSADKTGWESPHRWMSAVGWSKGHILHNLMTTNLGFPVVNSLGANDDDLESLSERCPFNWETMKWMRDAFPNELDLKIDRDFN